MVFKIKRLTACRIGDGCRAWVMLTAFLWLAGWVSADMVRFIPDAGDSWNQRVRLMKEAKSTIDVAMFIWKDDQVGREMAGLLKEAAERGVKVRVLCDALARSVPRQIMRVLERHPNLHLHQYHPVQINRPFWLNRRLHDKMMIVDQTHLILGGRNFADRYFDLGEDWNYIDLDVAVRGGVTEGAVAYFDLLWNSTHVKDLISPPLIGGLASGQRADTTADTFPALGAKAERREGSEPRCLIEVRSGDIEFVNERVPRKIDGAVCLRRLRELIAEAKSEVWITTPWLVMTRGSRELFRDCLARGVKIHILTNSLHANKDFLVFAAHLKSCEDLAFRGASIHCLPGPDSIHSKGIVIDQRVAIVGTQNLDPRSEFWNTESLVVVKSEKAAGDLRSAILGQAEGSEVLSAGRAALSGRGRTGFSTRIKRALLPFLKLVSPFMRSCL